MKIHINRDMLVPIFVVIKKWLLTFISKKKLQQPPIIYQLLFIKTNFDYIKIIFSFKIYTTICFSVFVIKIL